MLFHLPSSSHFHRVKLETSGQKWPSTSQAGQGSSALSVGGTRWAGLDAVEHHACLSQLCELLALVLWNPYALATRCLVDAAVAHHVQQYQGLGSEQAMSVAQVAPTRNCSQDLAGWCGLQVNPNIRRDKWTADEDAKLIELVKTFGVGRWAEIARNCDGRTDQQCMGRWRRHLDPAIRRVSGCTVTLIAVRQQQQPAYV